LGKFWASRQSKTICAWNYAAGMSQQVRHLYEFGPFLLDATERLLLRDKQHIPLTPKAFETLLVLVEHGGHVIDKDELMKKVWPNTFVEEVNLAKNVSSLRKILAGEHCDHYIETIPKRGYRFIAGVREIWAQEPAPIAAEAEIVSMNGSSKAAKTIEIAHAVDTKRKALFNSVESSKLSVVDSSRKRSFLNLIGLPTGFLLLGGVISVGIWFLIFSPTTKPPAPLLTVVPVTSFLGNEEQAAFSPDGNHVAFVWNGEKQDNSDIYVKLIGAETPLRLTRNPAPDTDPAWSPDGRYIAFLRQSIESGGVFLVSSLGGAERKLSDVFPYRPVVIGNTVSYSPDGKLLAVPDKSSQQQPFSIFSISIETGEKTKVTSPAAGSVGDFFPAFSPDQKTLAFVRSLSIAAADIYLLPFSGGEPKRLTLDNTSIRGLSWTADGNHIVFASRRGGSSYNLWKISTHDGKSERLTTAERDVYSPAISRQGNRLAYTQSLVDGNIWRLALRSFKTQKESPVKLISSSLEESGPQYSPDGKKIVFASRRSGSFEIWVCESDGTNPQQLTNIGGPLTGTPRWSPDGRQIAFDAWIEGNADIYLISVDGGKPRRLTYDADEDITPSWSRDGRWIYFGCTRSGSMQIWKVPVDGGSAVQVTKQGGFEGFESSDGQYFYYSKGRAIPGIWRIRVAGGEESPVIEEQGAGMWRYWAVTDEGIYFATAEAPSHPLISFFNFKTGKVTQVANLAAPLSKTDPGLAVSPDGQWLCVLQMDESGSDIVMAENFH
jgi:Tol biopolymer transport system component/DNA-binding winged helix-turn-helix (wHTH) protein